MTIKVSYVTKIVFFTIFCLSNFVFLSGLISVKVKEIGNVAGKCTRIYPISKHSLELKWISSLQMEQYAKRTSQVKVILKIYI